jgi:hypothetical protein
MSPDMMSDRLDVSAGWLPRRMGASRNGNHGVVEISQWVDKRLMEAKELPDDTSDADAP